MHIASWCFSVDFETSEFCQFDLGAFLFALESVVYFANCKFLLQIGLTIQKYCANHEVTDWMISSFQLHRLTLWQRRVRRKYHTVRRNDLIVPNPQDISDLNVFAQQRNFFVFNLMLHTFINDYLSTSDMVLNVI